jgi:hypothetical protein
MERRRGINLSHLIYALGHKEDWIDIWNSPHKHRSHTKVHYSVTFLCPKTAPNGHINLFAFAYNREKKRKRAAADDDGASVYKEFLLSGCELDPFDPFIHKLCGFNPNESSWPESGQQVNHSWSSRVREERTLLNWFVYQGVRGQTTEQFVSLKRRA